MRNPKLNGFLLSLVLLSALAVVLLIRSYSSNSADVEQAKVIEIQDLTRSAAAQVAVRVARAKQAASFVAGVLSSQEPTLPADFENVRECTGLTPPVSRQGAEACLEALVRAAPDFFGASITDRPSPSPHSIYFYKPEANGAITRGSIPEEYATSGADGYRWYWEPMTSGQDGWCPPYYDDAGQVLMTTYSALFRAAGETLGVVTIDIAGDQIRELVQDLELGPSGYGALSAADGSYLYHPNPEYVQGHRTILDVASEKGDQDRVQMWEAMKRGESGTIHHTSTLTGEDSWLLFASVGDSGWHLQNTFIKSEINFYVVFLRHKLIETASAAGVLLLALLIYGLHLDLSSERRWWWLSTGVSAVLLAEIGTIWALTLSHPPTREVPVASSVQAPGQGKAVSDACRNQQWMLQTGRVEIRRITEFGALHHLEAQYRQQAECRKSLEPVFVEVGTSIENLKFLPSNEVQVGGYLWQRIPASAPAGLTPNFTLANAIDLGKQELDSQTRPDGSRVKRWRFEATVAQNRNSTRYPIEREAVRIQFKHDEPVLWPSGPGHRGHRVYLVPALEDYDVMTPSSKPGVDRSLVVPGWRPKQSYFELSAPRRSSNLGLGVSPAELVPPDLNFSIVFERDFADAFISNLTPIIVVAIMLFAVLMVSAKLDYGRALSICMGMFFVIVFGHIDLRQRLAAQHIFYLEYFFFTIYAMILAVSFACLLQAFNTKIAWFEHRSRLFVKIAYWPILLGSLYACTLVAFY